MVGDLPAVISAVEGGQDVNALDDDGATALMGASTKGKLEVVDYLLCKGANANTKV
jgi:ankyrin repeat protein